MRHTKHPRVHTGQQTSLSSSIALSMVHTLRGFGVDVESLLAEVNLDPLLLANPDGRIDGPAMERLWSRAVEATGDPHLGLHLGMEARVGTLSVLGYVLESAENIGTALEAFARYIALFTNGLSANLIRPPAGSLGGQAILELRPTGTVHSNYLLRSPRHPMEATLVGARIILETLAARPLTPPIAIDFAHAGSDDSLQEAHRLLGKEVSYGAACYRLNLSVLALETPVHRASSSLHSAFAAQAATALASLNELSPHSTRHRVAEEIMVRLRGRVPSLEEIAQACALGTRTLQRRLRDEHTRYHAVVDEARLTLAIQHLRQNRLSASELAFLLGFSEPSAFTRAFKRWTGETPSSFRERTFRSLDPERSAEVIPASDSTKIP